MAERPRELDQRFRGGVNLRLNYRLKGYFSRHCDMTQLTLTHNSFSVAGPRVWNSLPASLRQPDVEFGQFKRLLKSFLFGEIAAHL